VKKTLAWLNDFVGCTPSNYSQISHKYPMSKFITYTHSDIINKKPVVATDTE